MFSSKFEASFLAYVFSRSVVPANSFILAPSRVNLYVVFLVSVVLSGVTVIPEFSSLVTSTESFAIFVLQIFFTANLYSLFVIVLFHLIFQLLFIHHH
ncbi:hypothetical protein QQA45_06355, partial [Sneathia sanguinegens]